MRHSIFAVLFAFVSLGALAQDCVIPMGVYIASQRLPKASADLLHNRLSNAITCDGIEGGDYSLFDVIASVEEVQEETVAGLRPTHLKIFNLNLSVGNSVTGETFCNTSMELRGSGQSQERAFNAAFSQLTSSKPELVNMIRNAKSKIINYYDTQIPSILAEANKYQLQSQYEEAFCLLASVPTCCNGYSKVEKALTQAFQAYIDYDCAEKIMKARAVWAASQTKESAVVAGAYLSAVSPNASCNGEAVSLLKQIQSRMGEEWDLKKELVRGAMSLESERIQAARAIGVAYGQNQKPTTYNEHWIVR